MGASTLRQDAGRVRRVRGRPWIAVYVEATDTADLFLVGLKNFERIYEAEGKALVRFWRMTPKYQSLCTNDTNVLHIRRPI